MLLQKTLVNIEGLGRQLYPDLDLWATAKPFMKKWITEKYSLKNTLKSIKQDWPEISDKGGHAPKMILNLLHQCQQRAQYKPLVSQKQQREKRRERKKGLLIGLGFGLIIMSLLGKMIMNLPELLLSPFLLLAVLGGVCWFIVWVMDS